MNDTAVAEIVTFRLTPDTDQKAFAQAAAAMMPFLRGTGAFLTRTLSVDDTGLWTDHITWTSRAAAVDAAAAVMARPEAAPFMAMIEPCGVVMRHAALHLAEAREENAPH